MEDYFSTVPLRGLSGDCSVYVDTWPVLTVTQTGVEGIMVWAKFILYGLIYVICYNLQESFLINFWQQRVCVSSQLSIIYILKCKLLLIVTCFEYCVHSVCVFFLPVPHAVNLMSSLHQRRRKGQHLAHPLQPVPGEGRDKVACMALLIWMGTSTCPVLLLWILQRKLWSSTVTEKMRLHLKIWD